MQSTELKEVTNPKKVELILFVFLSFILIPALTVGLVGVYGFSVWAYQMFISGPPVS
ncbi:MAG: periplasmic nitrate reductase, NapE protein [Sneathiella sp.]